MSRHAFVLAGGQGSRMGFDKARAPWRGQAMAASVAEVVAQVATHVTLVRRGAPDGLPWVDRQGRSLSVVYEPDDGPRHPLAGVVRALELADGADILVVPCDVPHLGVAALRQLCAQGPCVAHDGDRVHPLVAVLPTGLLGRARALWQAEAPARRLVEGLSTCTLPAAELRNANRPEDVDDPLGRLAERLPTGEDVERILQGERARWAARGVLCPVRGEGVPWPR